jgi:hypothetical protein
MRLIPYYCMSQLTAEKRHPGPDICSAVSMAAVRVARTDTAFITELHEKSAAVVGWKPTWDLRSSEILRSVVWLRIYVTVAGFVSFSDSWPLKIGPIRCPETSLNNYHTMTRNIPEERRSHQHGVGSLKSTKIYLPCNISFPMFICKSFGGSLKYILVLIILLLQHDPFLAHEQLSHGRPAAFILWLFQSSSARRVTGHKSWSFYQMTGPS